MSPLEDQIREQIEEGGPISFARFMELALYSPGLGYYEQRRKIGREGDFYTSVSVGPLFGQLLAFQFSRWMDAGCPSSPIQWVEAGAHDGRLALDILDWLGAQRPDLLARLEYVILESSEIRRAWQKEMLGQYPVRWVRDISDAGAVTGIIFSNEFLDALPVHRLAWNAADRCWREYFVGIEGAKFAWRLETTSLVPPVDAELSTVLPEGFVMEVCPAGEAWWRTAAHRLRAGKLLTIDYGGTREERFRPERADGTLRTFSRHHGGADLLARPGEQDLTADVDFSALEATGTAAGLRTERLVSQAKFLTEIIAQKPFGDDLDSKRVRQFQTLTHPEHLGSRFRVFIQSRANPR